MSTFSAAEKQAAVVALERELSMYFKEAPVGVDARRAQGTSVIPIQLTAADPIDLDGGVRAFGAVYGRFTPRVPNTSQSDLDSRLPVDETSADFKVDLTAPNEGNFLVRVGTSFKSLSPLNFRFLAEAVLEAVVQSAEMRDMSSDDVDTLRVGAAIKGAELVTDSLFEYFKVPTGPFFAFLRHVIVEPIAALGLDSGEAAKYQLATANQIKGALATIATAEYQPAQNQIASIMANVGIDLTGEGADSGEGGSGGGSDGTSETQQPATAAAAGATTYVLWGLWAAAIAGAGYMLMKRRG